MKSKINALTFKLKSVGPAALVTAAFIGPGTVTTCSIAGATFGYALLWGLLFSVIATIVLQEMSARLGIVTRKGLGEALRDQIKNPIMKFLTEFLVISAIGIGNAAYETGNILGAALGLETITGISQFAINSSFSINLWGPIIGLVAFGLMSFGSYKSIEKLLIFLVILMSVAFITTSIVVAPSLGEILKGTFIPNLPEGSLLTVVALIGTTVVPYNLFLHASAVQEKWNDASRLKEARTDILISIAIGGLISMSIVITSATAFMGTETQIKSASDMAFQLKPVLGSWATFFIAFGLFAAGVSSAVTAPLAAAYATAGILGWNKDFKNPKFKAVWTSIVLVGIIGSAFGLKPIQAIVFAQITNGILLPVIAVYLLWIMNNSSLLGEFRNKVWSNSIGGIVVLIAIALGVKSIVSVLGFG